MVEKNVFDKNPKKTIVLVIIFSLILIDVAAANTYRMIYGFNLRDSILHEQQRLEHLYRIKSDEYHHDLKKNIDDYPAAWGGIKYKITTDSLGFKSQHPGNTPLAADHYRILFLGDSFTEGVGVEYE